MQFFANFTEIETWTSLLFAKLATKQQMTFGVVT
jgi:hypothetical protein